MILMCFMNGQKWLLQFIPQKTKAVFFSLKNVEKFPELFFGDCTSEYVSQHKYLGVLLSFNLGWSDHIDNIVKNCFQIYFSLNVYFFRTTTT